jgi:pimeloyl-ACP methyl ester carboxylesterase
MTKIQEAYRLLIPGARMVVVPGAGHSVYFEEPFDTACIT